MVIIAKISVLRCAPFTRVAIKTVYTITYDSTHLLFFSKKQKKSRSSLRLRGLVWTLHHPSKGSQSLLVRINDGSEKSIRID